MNKTELLDQMEAQSSVHQILDRNPQGTSRGGAKFYEIPFLRNVGGASDHLMDATQRIIVIGEGEASEEAYYHGAKTFEVDPDRSPFFTDAQYISGIESNFTGWKVLELQVRVDGDMDILKVKGSDGQNIVNKRIGVWMEGGSPKFKLFE